MNKYIAHITTMVILGLGVGFFQSWWVGLLFSSGLVLGSLLPWLDRQYFYQWYTEHRSTAPQYASQSLLVMLVSMALAIYVISSTASPLGQGMILGYTWHLAWFLIMGYRRPDLLNYQLGVKTALTATELQLLVGVTSSLVVILSGITIFR